MYTQKADSSSFISDVFIFLSVHIESFILSPYEQGILSTVFNANLTALMLFIAVRLCHTVKVHISVHNPFVSSA